MIILTKFTYQAGTSDKRRGKARSVAGKVTKYVGRSKTRAAAAAAGASKGKGKAKQLGDSEEEGDETGGDGGTANFQDVLNTVIEAIAVDHPHHALWQIFALSNGDRVVAAQKSKNRYLVDNDKATAAKGYLFINALQVVQFLIFPSTQICSIACGRPSTSN
jgi:hypothetical protein